MNKKKCKILKGIGWGCDKKKMNFDKKRIRKKRENGGFGDLEIWSLAEFGKVLV